MVGSPRIDPAIFAGAKESFNVIVPDEVNATVGNFVPSLFSLSFKAWMKNARALTESRCSSGGGLSPG